MDIKQGIYRHWKGGEYDVVGVALNRDSGIKIVVYRPRYGERRLEYKTVAEWTEIVTRDGYTGPRYWLLVSNQEGPQNA